MMTVINQKAIIAACAEFGARIGTQLNSREGDAFDIALKACLAALASKPITKKASASGPSASKLEKISKKQAEIKQLGGTVDETVTTLKELNAVIKDLKAVKKAERRLKRTLLRLRKRRRKPQKRLRRRQKRQLPRAQASPRMSGELLCSPTKNSERLPSGLARTASV